MVAVKMALASDVLRTSRCNLLLSLLLHIAASSRGDILSVGSAECSGNGCRYTIAVPRGSSWRLTPEPGARGDVCGPVGPEYVAEQVGPAEDSEGSAVIEVTVRFGSERLFFCGRDYQRPQEDSWIHQGIEVFLGAELEPNPLRQVRPELKPASENCDNAIQNVNLDLHGATQGDETRYSFVSRKENADAVKERLEYTTAKREDLSHDTDVNNRVGEPRITKELDDILVFTNVPMDQYLPLSEFDIKLKKIVEDVKETYGMNDKVVDGVIDIKLPKQTENESYVRTLGTNYSIIKDNNIIDFIETVHTSDAREINESIVIREKRELSNNEDETDTKEFAAVASALHSSRRNSDDEFTSVKGVIPMRTHKELKIEGIRIEKSTKPPEVEDGIPSVLAFTEVTLRLFGSGITEHTLIGFTHARGKHSETCEYRLKGEYSVKLGSVTPDGTTAEVTFTAPEPVAGNVFYLCARNTKQQLASKPGTDSAVFVHQGSSRWVTLKTHNRPLPLWAMLLLISVCLMFSALFSGLNLGLMSLDRTELKIIANTGTDTERRHARAIQPVRDHGNYLLCSILLGNVAVNSTFTILLDDLMPGLLAVVFSTLAIVCLGEIVPQAICSRHGLMIGAKTIVITKTVMGITAPLAYPVSKLLDYFLGEEIGNVYNRERLKELVKVTNDINDLDKDEVNIISGALELRKKTVTEVMTRIEDVFMLSSDSVLDFETMSEIVKSGFSRIPVYEGSRTNIVTVLFIKDLAFVDPDDNTPLRTLCQFYQNPCNFVFEDTRLDVMFRQFKEGHKGHMAFVHRVNNEGEGDPFYETIGLVTLEDVIEELIQAEIVDETDVFTDNRSKRRRNRPTNKLQDFAAFAERRENQRIRISPQLTLATFQFLASSVDAFRPDVVSETVLRRLLRQDIIHQIKCKGKDKQDPSTLVYTQGKPADYFVLILEGRVEVTVGRESLVFEAGPFTYFGLQALTQNVAVVESPTPSTVGSLQNINMDSMLRYTFIPDYSVRAITEVFYITIKRSLYLAAKRATLMEKTSSLTKGGASVGEQFDSEVDKVDAAALRALIAESAPPSGRASADEPRATCSSATAAAGSARQYVARKFSLPRASRTDPEADPQKVPKKAHFDTTRSLESVEDALNLAGEAQKDPKETPSDETDHKDAQSVKADPISIEELLLEEVHDESKVKAILEEKLFDLELERIRVENERLAVEKARVDMEMEVLVQLQMILNILNDREHAELLQSLDEDGSIAGDQRTPSRQISPSVQPASASHAPRSVFTSAAGSPAAAPRAPSAPPPPPPANNGDVTYKFPPGQQIETDDK